MNKAVGTSDFRWINGTGKKIRKHFVNMKTSLLANGRGPKYPDYRNKVDTGAEER